MVVSFSKCFFIDWSISSLIGLFLDYITKHLVWYLEFVSKISLKALVSSLTRNSYFPCLPAFLCFFCFHSSSFSTLTFSSYDTCSRFLFWRVLPSDFFRCYTFIYLDCVSFLKFVIPFYFLTYFFFYCYTLMHLCDRLFLPNFTSY